MDTTRHKTQTRSSSGVQKRTAAMASKRRRRSHNEAFSFTYKTNRFKEVPGMHFEWFSRWRKPNEAKETSGPDVQNRARCSYRREFKEGPSMNTREERAAHSSIGAPTTETKQGAESGVLRKQRTKQAQRGRACHKSLSTLLTRVVLAH